MFIAVYEEDGTDVKTGATLEDAITAIANERGEEVAAIDMDYLTVYEGREIKIQRTVSFELC